MHLEEEFNIPPITTISEEMERRLDTAIDVGFIETRKKRNVNAVKTQLRKHAKVYIPSRAAREWADVLRKAKEDAAQKSNYVYDECNVDVDVRMNVNKLTEWFSLCF